MAIIVFWLCNAFYFDRHQLHTESLIPHWMRGGCACTHCLNKMNDLWMRNWQELALKNPKKLKLISNISRSEFSNDCQIGNICSVHCSLSDLTIWLRTICLVCSLSAIRKIRVLFIWLFFIHDCRPNSWNWTSTFGPFHTVCFWTGRHWFDPRTDRKEFAYGITKICVWRSSRCVVGVARDELSVRHIPNLYIYAVYRATLC